MARNLEATISSNLALGVVKPAFFVTFEFPSGDTRWWTGSGNLSWDDGTGDGSQSFIGLGNLTNIELPKESQDGSAQALNFGISGIPSANTSLALTESYQNSPVTVWLATMSDATTISGTPYEMFYGLVDVMEMTDDGSTAAITVKTEGFAYGVGPSEARRTEQDQIERHGGDPSLRYVAKLEEQEFLWGVKE